MQDSPLPETEARGLNKEQFYKGLSQDHRQRLHKEEDKDEQEGYRMQCVGQVTEARLSKTIGKCTN